MQFWATKKKCWGIHFLDLNLDFLETVGNITFIGHLYRTQTLNICEDSHKTLGCADGNPLGVQEHGQGWEWNNYKGGVPKDLQESFQGAGH